MLCKIGVVNKDGWYLTQHNLVRAGTPGEAVANGYSKDSIAAKIVKKPKTQIVNGATAALTANKSEKDFAGRPLASFTQPLSDETIADLKREFVKMYLRKERIHLPQIPKIFKEVTGAELMKGIKKKNGKEGFLVKEMLEFIGVEKEGWTITQHALEKEEDADDFAIVSYSRKKKEKAPAAMPPMRAPMPTNGYSHSSNHTTPGFSYSNALKKTPPKPPVARPTPTISPMEIPDQGLSTRLTQSSSPATTTNGSNNVIASLSSAASLASSSVSGQTSSGGASPTSPLNILSGGSGAGVDDASNSDSNLTNLNMNNVEHEERMRQMQAMQQQQQQIMQQQAQQLQMMQQQQQAILRRQQEQLANLAPPPAGNPPSVSPSVSGLGFGSGAPANSFDINSNFSNNSSNNMAGGASSAPDYSDLLNNLNSINFNDANVSGSSGAGGLLNVNSLGSGFGSFGGGGSTWL